MIKIILLSVLVLILMFYFMSEHFKAGPEKKAVSLYTSGASMRLLAQEPSDASQGSRSTLRVAEMQSLF